MPTSESAAAEEPVYRKVVWRIIPILFLCYIAAYLDRVNVGFAKLQMQSDLPQISDTVFGLGAGIFFLGYFFISPTGSRRAGAGRWLRCLCWRLH